MSTLHGEHGSGEQDPVPRTRSPEVHVPQTTEKPSDTGGGKPADEASTHKVSTSVTHGGTSGHGHGEPVPESTDIPEPTPDHSQRPGNEGTGPAPLGS